MRTKRLPVIGLTMYLIKDGTTEEAALNEEVRQTLTVHPVILGARQLGNIYAKQSPTTPPRWMSLFAGSVGADAKFRRTSVSAVYITKAAKRLFAVVFGQGRFFLNTESIEDRFGLRVTLNSVDPDKLRLVDLTTSDANPVHTRRQTSRLSGLNTFGINLDQDILRAVAGTPADPAIGTHMSGVDSLTVRARITLSSLHRALLKFLAISDEKTYQASFKWVDQVAEVREEALKSKLFDKAADVLNGGEGGRIWGAIPDLIDWSRFDGFRIGTPSGKRAEDIDTDAIRDAFDGEPASVEALRRRQIHQMTDDAKYPLASWSFMRCLAGEVRLNGSTFILNSESWYRIDDAYAAQIDRDIESIPKSTIALPVWGDVTEGVYNERVSTNSSGSIALMDQVMVKHDGMVSPIEFCDLYTKQRQLVHIKQFSQSSVLSHLFSQGLVSASSLLGDIAFRKRLNELLPAAHRLGDPGVRPVPDQYEVVFAIGSSQVGPLQLPFFSRVTLRNVFRQLTQSLGFRMSIAKITRNRLAAF